MQSGFGGQPASGNVSEDCLYLNIFVSASSHLNFMSGKGVKKPILIFIHGGRFILVSQLKKLTWIFNSL